MRPLAVLLLPVLLATPSPPLIAPSGAVRCPVALSTRPLVVGQLVTVTPTLACPLGATAHVRFRSRTGSQPDNPPGFFVLKRGDRITRLVPRSWWIEERDKFFRWFRVLTPRS